MTTFEIGPNAQPEAERADDKWQGSITAAELTSLVHGPEAELEPASEPEPAPLAQPERHFEEADRLGNTARTQTVAHAENAYRTEHPLPANPSSGDRTQHEAGSYMAANEALVNYDMPKVQQEAPREVREKVATGILPEAETEHRQERQRLERSAQRAADYDTLTGLANRAALDKALPAAEADPNLAIGVFDANKFGKINKKKGLGQTAGDAALIMIAHAVDEAAQQHGVAKRVFSAGEEVQEVIDGQEYRRGGDEFVVIAPKDKINDVIADACRAVDDRLASSEPLVYGDEQFATADIRKLGVSLTGTSANTFKEADDLLQAAKKLRKSPLRRTIKRIRDKIGL